MTEPPPGIDPLAVVLNTVDFVWSTDSDARFTYLSEGFARVTGRPVSEALGRRARDLPWFRNQPEAVALRGALLAARAPLRDSRFIITRADGEVRLFSVSGQARFEADGAYAGYSGIALDVTESSRAEAVFDTIAQALGGTTGANYFGTLVRAVAEVLDVELAFVACPVGGGDDRLATLAVHERGGMAANFTFDLAGTPSAAAFGGELNVVPAEAARSFPADRVLVERGIESYCGAPLIGAEGRRLGILVVADTRPFTNTDLIRNVVRLFADRATTELERQAIERSLREGQSLLLQSQRIGRTGYIISDMRARRVTFSETMLEMRGMAPRPWFSFEETFAFIHPEDRPALDLALRTSAEQRRPYEIEVRVIRPDGQIIWERSIGHPLFDAEGRLERRLVFVQEVTQQKQAEIALRERERDLRAILDNAPVAMFLKDEASRYRVVNRQFERWFNRPQASILGLSDGDIAPPEVAELSRRTDVQVLRDGGHVIYERPAYGAEDREVQRLLVTKFPIRDADQAVVGIAGFLTDVTSRWRAEEALRQSEERFRALIEHSNDLVVVVGLDGTLRYHSPSVTQGLGLDQDALAGRSILDLVHRDDAAGLAAALRRIGDSPGAREAGEGRVRHREGGWRHIAWTARNAADIRGVEGIIVNARDVTEARRLEEQLLQAQKMEAVGQLAGGIAHDFNNVLSVVLGFAGFLVEDLPPGTREHGFAARIVHAGERARDLVRQILTFSSQSGVERRPEDLGRVVRETGDLLRGSLPSSTRLEIDAPVPGPLARVNAGQIGQVLLNLCLNANDALMGEPGTIGIVVDTLAAGQAVVVAPDESVTLGSLDPARGHARLTVRDTGCGMPLDVLRRAFNPFFTTKERGRGTGLGLAMVHGIVQASEGACVAISRPRGGTTFMLHFPLLETAQAADAAPRPARALRGRERVLVVDDDVDVTDMLTTGLDRLGYDTVALNDPREALAVFEADPAAWDVVVSDQVMPDMKGLTLHERMRARWPALRFILCTGFSDGATEEQATARGIAAFFLKPVAVERLAERIRELMDGSGS